MNNKNCLEVIRLGLGRWDYGSDEYMTWEYVLDTFINDLEIKDLICMIDCKNMFSIECKERNFMVEEIISVCETLIDC